jgi:PrtD family type I secretion system ABC transporter
MTDKPDSTVKNELLQARAALPALLLFSFIIAVMALTPSIYMIQMFERVMQSRNETTLLFLTLIAVFLVIIWTVITSLRTKLLQRLAVSIDQRLSEKVFAAIHKARSRASVAVRDQALGDLNVLREFIAGSMTTSLLDVIFAPVFIVVVFLIHPILGLVLMAMMVLITVLTVINQIIVKDEIKRAQASENEAGQFARSVMNSSDAVRVMGMVPALGRRWRRLHDAVLDWQAAAQSRSEKIATVLRVLRNLQMIIFMVVGVILFLHQQIGAGAIFAVTILSSRAMGPVDAIASGWKVIWNAILAVDRLDGILIDAAGAERINLPRPTSSLRVSRIVLSPPNRDSVVLNDVSFQIRDGSVLGIVGPSGAGKSSLAKVLVGAWDAKRGAIFLGDHELRHWDPDQLGRFIGYVPQEVELLPGTVAENISRFQDEAVDHKAVLAAADLAGINDIIQGLPDGFNTRLGGPGGHVLSGGQKQRVALARAVYGDPSLIVLDEPNSNLDAIGEQSLGRSILAMRERGASIVIVTHRMNILTYCDDVLVLNGGSVHAFGSRDQILARLSNNRLAPPKQDAGLLGEGPRERAAS